VTLAFYKDIVRSRGFTAEFSALLDNAFNHRNSASGWEQLARSWT
jgi:hypothetical protein